MQTSLLDNIVMAPTHDDKTNPLNVEMYLDSMGMVGKMWNMMYDTYLGKRKTAVGSFEYDGT